MALENKIFPLADWAVCPQNLPMVKKNLKTLSDAVHLRQLLDSLISVIYSVETALKNEELSNEREYLETLKKDSYRLAEVLCDQPNISYDQLLIIKAKRRISNAYLPNHLPGSDPEFIPISKYDIPEGPEKEKKVQFLEKVEGRLRRVHRLKTVAAAVKPLFRKKKVEADKISIPEIQTPAPSEIVAGAAKNSKLLFLKEDFFNVEALPKLIQNYELPLPGEKNPLRFLDLFYQATGTGGTKLPTYEDFKNILECYEKAYKRVLEEDQYAHDVKELFKLIQNSFHELKSAYLKEFEDKILNDKPKMTIQQEIYLTLYYLAEIRHHLLIQINGTEKLLKVKLSAIKKEVVNATLGYNPAILANFLEYRIQNEFVFDDVNHYLHVNYFRGDTQREPFRVHIFQGKCYRFEKTSKGIVLVPFSTATKVSHRKLGWAMLVMTTTGEIFADSHSREDKMLHSSFMAGGAVKFAGEIQVAEDGTILAFSNYSGHYGPSLEDFEEFGHHLEEQRGIDCSEIKFLHAVDAYKLNRRLENVPSGSEPSEKHKEQQKILDDSEELKFCECFMLINKQWQPVELPEQPEQPKKVELPQNDIQSKKATAPNFKKILLVASMMLLGVVGLCLLVAIILATKGIAVPFIGAAIFKAMAITSPSILSPMAGMATLLTSMPLLVLSKVFSVGKFIRQSFRSLGEKVFGSWLTKKSNHEEQILPRAERPGPSAVPEPFVTIKPYKPILYLNFGASTIVPKKTQQNFKDKNPSCIPLFALRRLTSHASNKNVDPVKDIQFNLTWNVYGGRSSYPEWIAFLTSMAPVMDNKEKNFKSILPALKQDLRELSSRMLKKDALTRQNITIWDEGNILKLMNKIARKLAKDPEFLALVEAELFVPLCKQIADFWKPFKEPAKTPLFELYTQQLEIKAPHDNQAPILSS